MTIRSFLLVHLLVAAGAVYAQGADWITAPSYFTHHPQTGQRVNQYAPIGPFFTYPRGDFRQSGYHHTRSSIQAGGSSDHYHLVEEWGGDVRPYGEWRFPYRPYSVPYDLWGPQHPGFGHFGHPLHGQAHRGFGGRFPRGFPPAGGGDPGDAPPGAAPLPRAQPYPGYFPQPWDDGRYPPYDSSGPYGYPDLLLRPPTTPPRSG